MADVGLDEAVTAFLERPAVRRELEAPHEVS
jgi:hypothetical protein